MITVSERTGRQDEALRQALESLSARMRVAMPGIIHSFNSATQTAEVQPTVKETILDENGAPQVLALPLLLDVPVVFPRAGGFVLTMPVALGDECLVVFADRCIDAWWQSGGLQPEAELRRHDLSDGFAILGPWSQARLVSNFNTAAAELRSEDGGAKITLNNSGVTIQASSVDINGTVRVNGVVI